jgi:precorrin-6Y C5,15-methyltransferase (decarboxylating)
VTDSQEPLVVIGIGPDGPDGLSPEALGHIGHAQILVGGKRHLELFPDWAGDKIVIGADLAGLVDRLRRCVRQQKTVVLASGDPLFYGIGRRLLESFPREELLFLPTLSSVQLAFARVKETWDDALILSLHGRPPHALRAALQRRQPKIALLTDARNHPGAIAELLREMGCDRDYAVWVCEDLGGPDERVTRWAPCDLAGARFSPLNVVILLRIGERQAPPPGRAPLLGIPEQILRHHTGRGALITRREVRLLSLCALDLHPDDVLWDVGAGSGSVSIEAARLSPSLRILAVEKDAEALANLEENVKTFALPGVRVIPGEAPDVFGQLPDPDAVFVGGSGGRLQPILAGAEQRLRPGGRLVVNCVTLDSLALAWHWLHGRDLDPAVTSVQLAHSRPLGTLHSLEPESPVFILRATKR